MGIGTLGGTGALARAGMTEGTVLAGGRVAAGFCVDGGADMGSSPVRMVDFLIVLEGARRIADPMGLRGTTYS